MTVGADLTDWSALRKEWAAAYKDYAALADAPEPGRELARLDVAG